MSPSMPGMSSGSNSPTQGAMENSDNIMGMMMMMQNNFYWGKDTVILFSGWPGHSLGMYILALFFVFVLAAAVEVLSAVPLLKLGSSKMTSSTMHAAVYTLRMGVAYLVMLSVMSFNLGIFIVAVVGHGIGFFVAKTCFVAAAVDQTTNPTPPDTVKI